MDGWKLSDRHIAENTHHISIGPVCIHCFHQEINLLCVLWNNQQNLQLAHRLVGWLNVKSNSKGVAVLDTKKYKMFFFLFLAEEITAINIQPVRLKPAYENHQKLWQRQLRHWRRIGSYRFGPVEISAGTRSRMWHSSDGTSCNNQKRNCLVTNPFTHSNIAIINS